MKKNRNQVREFYINEEGNLRKNVTTSENLGQWVTRIAIEFKEFSLQPSDKLELLDLFNEVEEP